MAGEIDIIVTSQAQESLEQLLKRLKEVENTISEIATKSLGMNSAISGVKNPSDLGKYLEEIEKRNLALKKEQENYKKIADGIAKQIEEKKKLEKLSKDFSDKEASRKAKEIKDAEKLLQQYKKEEQEKQAQIKKTFEEADALRKKDLAREEAKLAKEIEINNKRVASEEVKAKRLQEIQQRSQARIDGINSRTGANSVIPGMSQKIAFMKQEEAEAKKTASAYRQLTFRLSEATVKYQDLIVRGKLATQTQKQFNQELEVAKNKFTQLKNRVEQADKAVGNFGSTGQKGLSFAKNLLGAFGIVGGVQMIADLTMKTYEQIKVIQSLDFALKTATETSTNFYKQQRFLMEISEQYGADIDGLTSQYTKFYIASKDKLGSKEIQQIFESVTKSAGVLGLTLEARERSFYALNQMMSKGTVQAEELKQQLGDSLPNAFNIMVKAYQKLHPEMKVTEESFRQLMKDGKILSSEVLPEFARQLEKSYGVELLERVDTLAAKQERAGNAWSNMVRRFSEGNGLISKSVGFLLDGFTFSLNNLETLIKLSNPLFAGIKDMYDYLNKSEKEYQDGKVSARENASKLLKSFDNEEKRLSSSKIKEENKLLLLQKKSQGQKGQDLEITKKQISQSESKINLLDKQIKKQQELSEQEKKDYRENAIRNNKLLEADISGKSLDRDKIKTDLSNAELRIKQKGYGNRSKDLQERRKLIAEQSKVEEEIRKLNLKIIYNNTIIDATNPDNITNKVVPENSSSGTGKSKAIKEQKEKIRLNFEEVQSELELRKVKLENEQSGYYDIMNDEKDLFANRIKARENYNRVTTILIDNQLQIEKAKNLEAWTENNQKNNEALVKGTENNEFNKKNNLISDEAYWNEKIRLNEQFNQNIQDIQKTYDNENLTAKEVSAEKQKDLDRASMLFYKGIEEKKQGFLRESDKLIRDSQIENLAELKENEKLSLDARQQAYEAWFKLKKQELQIQYEIDKAKATSPEEEEAVLRRYESAFNNLSKIKSPFVQAKEDFNEYLKSLSSGYIENSLDSIGLSSLKMFTDLDAQGQSTFEKLFAQADTFGEKSAVIFQGVGDVFQETMALMNSSSDARFEAEKQRAEESYNTAVRFAGQEAFGRAKLDREYEKKKKEIALRQFNEKQKQAKTNVIIDMAQAIIGAVAAYPATGGLPFSAIAAGIGAIQLAIISNQKPPEYKNGTPIGGHKGGFAKVNDGSGANYKEIIKTPDGKMKMFEGRDLYMDLPIGTKVFNAQKTMDMLGFDNSLNRMLTNNNILAPIVKVQNDNIALERKLDRLTDVVQNKQSVSVNIGKDGLDVYVRNGHSTKEMLNKQIDFKGTGW